MPNVVVADTLVANSVVGPNKRSVLTSTGALPLTLTTDDSGALILCNGAVTNVVTLPAPSSGVQFDFVYTDATAVVSITSTGANVFGVLFNQADTNEDTNIPCAGVTTVAFAAPALVGDRLSLVSDGTSYHAHGVTAAQLGFTTA
jgi:hypothetical protein